MATRDLLEAYYNGHEIVDDVYRQPVVYVPTDDCDSLPWVTFGGEMFSTAEVTVTEVPTMAGKRVMCDECGKRKRDVEHMQDPYAWELDREVWMRDLCGDCQTKRTNEI